MLATRRAAAKTTQPSLLHASSDLPQLGDRGQCVSNLRGTAQISATGHSAPCAGRRHDYCQLNEADWWGFDVPDADETDAILALSVEGRLLADRRVSPKMALPGPQLQFLARLSR